MMKKSELIEGIDPDWSFEELKKHMQLGYQTTTFGRAYPQVAIRGKKLWVDFEYDLSKIRAIHKVNQWDEWFKIYDRHGWLSWLK